MNDPQPNTGKGSIQARNHNNAYHSLRFLSAVSYIVCVHFHEHVIIIVFEVNVQSCAERKKGYEKSECNKRRGDEDKD